MVCSFSGACMVRSFCASWFGRLVLYGLIVQWFMVGSFRTSWLSRLVVHGMVVSFILSPFIGS